jgi:small subunit ribosomal protein S6|nr:30S ribosomal protein S6 [Clostridia bacterium]
MEKVNAAYETLFIVDLSLGDDGVRAMTDRFLAMIAEAGEITETSEWGKRRLAYPINDLNEGYYVLVNYTAPAEFPAELERVFNITEGIMRSMTIRLGE